VRKTLRRARNRRPAELDHQFCEHCGEGAEGRWVSWRFRAPDRIQALADDSAVRVANSGDFMKVDDEVAYVRVLLKGRLTGGRELVLGIFLEVTAEEMHRVFQLWGTGEHTSLVVSGTIANRLEPWGDRLFGVRAEARPPDGNSLPQIFASPDALLMSILTEELPYEEIATALSAQ